MSKIIYFNGGIRSGKSKHAEEYIENSSYEDKIYLATAIAFDDEMKDRIAKHKLRRENKWQTVEAYDDILAKLNLTEKKGVVLLDCLGNMISNQLLFSYNLDWDNISKEKINEVEAEIQKKIKEVLAFLKKSNYDLVIVSNEVGMSLVAPNILGRAFQDILGRTNQLVAEYCDEAYFVISGIKLKLK